MEESSFAPSRYQAYALELLEMERQSRTGDLQLRSEVPGRIALWTSLDERSKEGKPVFLRQRTECDNGIF
jgi:hypothetical protein